MEPAADSPVLPLGLAAHHLAVLGGCCGAATGTDVLDKVQFRNSCFKKAMENIETEGNGKSVVACLAQDELVQKPSS